MKKILYMTLALLMLGATEVAAQRKITWKWDGTKSGNEKIDAYLVNIDTLYRNVQLYKEQMANFTLKDDYIFVNDKVYVLTHMEDANGQLVSRARVNWQCAQAVAEGTQIVLDMTNAGLSSASAALELPSLGLKALSFAKYVKGGPAVISEGIKAIKDVRGQYMANSRRWKIMKDGAIDATTIGYDGFTPDVLEKLNKCYYVKPMREDDPDYAETIQRFTGKTPEEIAQENQAVAQQIGQSIVMPEDVTKQLEDLPDLPED